MTIPIHKEAVPSDKWVGGWSLLFSKLNGPRDVLVAMEIIFEKSINPWEETKRELPTRVKNKELKITTSGRNIDFRKHIDDNIQNNLEAVNIPKNAYEKIEIL